MAEEIRFFQLNTGAKIPSVGLGTFQAENPGTLAEAVTIAVKVKITFSLIFIVVVVWLNNSMVLIIVSRRANARDGWLLCVTWQVGYRHIDCASSYNNQAEVITN